MRYNFEECLEKTITIEGTVSSIPWQHMTGSFEDFPYMEYLDLDNQEQIVIYTKTQILKRKVRIKLTGKIIKLEGRSKRPGDHDTPWFEYQMLVDNWSLIHTSISTEE